MQQIHEAVQALESDIGFWQPSWILLEKLKKAKKITRQIPLANMHTANISKKSEQGFSSESKKKMQWRRHWADSAKTISLHHHIVGGD